MQSIWQDLRFGVRTLARRPGFTLTAALTLALGIGANTAIFSVVYSLMFRPLPVPEAERLVSVVTLSQGSRFHQAASYADYQDYRKLDRVFEDAAIFATDLFQVKTKGVPERLLATITSGNYFSTLGVTPFKGRFYRDGEGDVGGQASVVLSYGFWHARFGSDSSIVGQALVINDRPITVLGIAPRSFPGTDAFAPNQVYLSMSAYDLVSPGLGATLEDRSKLAWSIVARLRPGVGLEQAQSAVTAMAENLSLDHPDTNKGLRASVFPEPRTRLEPAAADYLPLVAGVFMAMVTLVLLIACANVANLLLARAAGRSKEMALRSALGAGRMRIVRQLLTESVLLAIPGGAGGLLIANWATSALGSIKVASDLPLQFDFSIDYNVFLFAAAITLGVGVLAGLAPGVFAGRTNLSEALKEGGRSESGSARQPLRSVLVSAQIAVALVLLICTALFVQSLLNVTHTNPGFARENRFMMSVDTSLGHYEKERTKIFFRDLVANVRALPGVESAATGRTVPVGFNNYGATVTLQGEGVADKEQEQGRRVTFNTVGPGYFETMGVPILQGRPLNDQDTETSRLTAVVNQRMAEEFWPGRDPLGQLFSTKGSEGPFMEVVGVAATGYYSVPGESPQPHFYVPYAQNQSADQILFVHSKGDPAQVLPAVRAEISKLDPDMPVFEVRTLKAHYEEGKAALLFRTPAFLVGAFAVVGAFLAAIGLYGLISYSVTQRTREIGIRIALGATTGSIIRLISRKSLVLAGTGIVVGLVAAYALTSLFASLLVGVGSSDPLTYAGVAVLVFVVALLSSMIPARLRAAKIDPAVSLRG